MIEAAVLGEDQDPSLDQYLQEWLAHTRGRVRATTYQGYESLIRCYALPALGEVRLSELSLKGAIIRSTPMSSAFGCRAREAWPRGVRPPLPLVAFE